MVDNLIKSTETELANFRAQLESLTELGVEAKVAAQLSETQQQVVTLGERFTRLEQTILDNPNRALTVPLLQKDVESMKDAHASEIGAVRVEVARIYDLNKWFIGLMVTMAVGMIALALGNLVRPGKPTPQEKPDGGEAS